MGVTVYNLRTGNFKSYSGMGLVPISEPRGNDISINIEKIQFSAKNTTYMLLQYCYMWPVKINIRPQNIFTPYNVQNY
jgi:hypothetical protein